MKKNISIIITARNYSMYLSEAILSCLNQTIQPFEIIYSDDFSSDNSIKIAKKHNVKIVSAKKHLGVIKARNNGANISKGNVLVFLDGDDLMPSDFLEKHLQTFDETTPFVYCSAQAFGAFNHFWEVKPWDTLNIWNRNFVNTSCMIWKKSFVKAGKWQDTKENTMWDWSMAIRLSRLGKPKKSMATLLYRQHETSWSKKIRKKPEDTLRCTVSIRKDLVNLSIGLIYSGRIPNFIHKWLYHLIEDIRFLNNKPQLIIINLSKETLYLDSYKKHFSEIKILSGKRINFESERERRRKVSKLLSEKYNIILENATGELVHLREDDIIPNKNSFKLLFDFLTDKNPVKNAVAGIYLNRNLKSSWGKKIVGGFYNGKSTKPIDKIENQEPFLIDHTGTGFLLFWKNICPTFEPTIDNINAHDWAWGKKLKTNKGQLYMIPEAICKHYHNEIDFIEYAPEIEITSNNTFTKPINNITVKKQRCIIIK